MKRFFSFIALSLCTLTLLSGNRVEAQSYTYVEMGQFNSLSSINNSGQITGTISTANGPRAFVITPLSPTGPWYQDLNSDGVNDLMTLLPLPSGYTGNIAHAINSSGLVAGETRPGQEAMFVGAGGTAEVLTSKGGVAFSINDGGALAGWAWDSGRNHYYAATWKKTVTRKGTSWTQTLLGAPTSYASSWGWAINNDGAVAGRATSQTSIVPVVWLPSALYGRPQGWNILPGLAGAGGDVRAINNLGQSAGQSSGHAVLWSFSSGSASVQDLHPANSVFTDSQANHLNNAPGGLLSVVGYMFNQVTERAFLWRSDTQQTIDLNDVTTGVPADRLLWEAVAINDSGVIIGYSVPPNADYSQTRWFVLVPNP